MHIPEQALEELIAIYISKDIPLPEEGISRLEEEALRLLRLYFLSQGQDA